MVCVVIAGTLIFSSGDRAGNSIVLRLIALLLFWPARLLVVGELDCPNADLISDKIGCIGLCVVIDLVAFSILIYLVLWLLEKRRRA